MGRAHRAQPLAGDPAPSGARAKEAKVTKDKQQRIIEAYEAALLARNYADCPVLDIVPEIEEAVPDASFPEIIAAIKVITDREIQDEEQKAAEDQKAVDDLCWARYERAEREHNVEQ